MVKSAAVKSELLHTVLGISRGRAMQAMVVLVIFFKVLTVSITCLVTSACGPFLCFEF